MYFVLFFPHWIMGHFLTDLWKSLTHYERRLMVHLQSGLQTLLLDLSFGEIFPHKHSILWPGRMTQAVEGFNSKREDPEFKAGPRVWVLSSLTVTLDHYQFLRICYLETICLGCWSSFISPSKHPGTNFQHLCSSLDTSSSYLFLIIFSAIVEADASKDTYCIQDTMLPLLPMTLTASSPTAHIIARKFRCHIGQMTGFSPHGQVS